MNLKKVPIVTMTATKVIIKWDRLSEVLSAEEKTIMNRLLGKITDFDKGETET